MNRIPKLVASRSSPDVSCWSNSTLFDGNLDRDLIVVGSASVTHDLIERGLVDEYRLLVFPTVAGKGKRLFSRSAFDLELLSCDRAGAATLLVYRRPPLR